ncbi:MAG: hypothetical protein K2P58_01355 [Hyphomonadaceae bacterium]|nr:hypothetical protein [Hyphomonadaceae bacterium]
MTRLTALVFALLIGLAAPTAAHAQQPTPEPEIVVTGQRLQEIMREFVGELAETPRSEDQLATWGMRLCPGVIGLRDRDTAQRIVDRIAQRAIEVGLEVGDVGCRPNVIIFFSPDASVLANELSDNFKRLMNYFPDNNTSTLGRAAFERFVSSEAPVRWWSVTRTMSRDGLDIEADGAARISNPSRLRRATRQDLDRVIVVVDVTRVNGRSTDSISDYLAMVSLAQIALDADVSSFPSILNFFNGGPSTLTEWDTAYLSGLYGATRDARNSSQQEREIARSMADDLSPPETEAPRE